MTSPGGLRHVTRPWNEYADARPVGGTLAEHVEVTGESRRRPSFRFLADLGERYNRMQAIGRFLFAGATGG